MHEYMSKERAWELTCPHSLNQVGRARRWTREILCGCPYVDDAALIVTELGTNALLHTASRQAGSGFHITVTRSGREVSIAVTDHGGTSTTPHVIRPTVDAQHGRGLGLVADLADRVEIHGDQHGGRTVTAYLNHPKEERDA